MDKPELNLVMGWLECLAEDESMMFHSYSEVGNIARSALALLKEQDNQIHHMGLIIEEYEKEKQRNPVIVCPHCGKRVR